MLQGTPEKARTQPAPESQPQSFDEQASPHMPPAAAAPDRGEARNGFRSIALQTTYADRTCGFGKTRTPAHKASPASREKATSAAAHPSPQCSSDPIPP